MTRILRQHPIVHWRQPLSGIRARNEGHELGPRILWLLTFTLASVLCLGVPEALAFNETGTVDPAITDCNVCHGRDYEAAGPHAGYASTSTKCVVCHSVHSAPANARQLMSGPTLKDTCEACHDGTGGRGVYGVLEARGVGAVSRHRVDVTNVVPGGDASTGGTATISFDGEGTYLSCGDCHSPHGSSVVASFTGDRMRTTTDTAGFTSPRLLRMRPGGAAASVTVYGSDWCAACHKGRMSETSTLHNHPAEGGTTFRYENIVRVTTETATTTAWGSLGRNNRGYVMPYPRSVEQTGHAPICQQCHEDTRSVGVPGAVDYFRVLTPDGGSDTDNPRFQTFPHESANPMLLVETGESLCLNCHDSGTQMP